MTKLSVNVNKLATLRNSREKNLPDVVACAKDILRFGAHGITVHPRPDGRHIRRADVFALSKLVRDVREATGNSIEFNVEGYPSDDFLSLIKEIRPDQCTLVPDPPEALTSNAGWKAFENREQLRRVLGQLKTWGVRSSLFIDPVDMNERQYESLGSLSPDRIELYTEAYSDAFATAERESVTATYANMAERAVALNIGINAGHDLNLNNLGYLIERIPAIDEVSIGHALICESLYLGLEQTIDAYLKRLKWRP